MHCDCAIFNSISKIKNISDEGLICTSCTLIEEYKKLVDSNKVDLIKDMNAANKKDKKRNNYNRRRRNNKNATNNKSNTRRALPKSRKKFKSKQK